jgi:hypothetical protein
MMRVPMGAAVGGGMAMRRGAAVATAGGVGS